MQKRGLVMKESALGRTRPADELDEELWLVICGNVSRRATGTLIEILGDCFVTPI